MQSVLRVGVVLLAISIVAGGCGKSDDGTGGTASNKPSWEMTDAQIRELPEGKHEACWREKMAYQQLTSTESEHAEAREWTKGPKNVGFEVSKKDMADIAEQLYAAGAKTVYVTAIHRIDPADFGGKPAAGETTEDPKSKENLPAMAGAMVAEFADEAGARKTCIEAAAKIIDEWEGELYPKEDYGQKYVVFIMD